MTLPEPPYTYDDPRLTYDEHCFFYDGGYDDVCLSAPTAVVVRKKGGLSSGGKRKEPELPFINIFIQSKLEQVNNLFFEGEPKITRFSGKDQPVSIFVNGVQFDTQIPYVNGEILKVLSEKPDLNASVEFLRSIKDKPDVEIVANNLMAFDENGKNIQVELVEDYRRIKIEAALVVTTNLAPKMEMAENIEKIPMVVVESTLTTNEPAVEVQIALIKETEGSNDDDK